MVSAQIVAMKLAELKACIDQVERHKPQSPEQFAQDRDRRDLVAFNLMLAVQICSDIAAHIISDERWPVAPTLGDAFRRLHEHGVIEQRVTAALCRAVGLRNVVAHGYAGVNVEMLFEAAQRGVQDLDDFSVQVARWLGSRP
jgi:uncharacterized protein YutE (UPF0331/DUF86 family)